MNATVSVPLSDIDNLRDEVKKYKEKAELLEKTEKQVKLVVELKTYETGYSRRPLSATGYVLELEEKYHILETKYINLEEVSKNLREQEEQKVASVLSSLKYNLKAEKESTDDKIRDIKTEYDKIIKAKNEEIAALKEGRETKTKDDLIKQLEDELKDQSDRLGHKYSELLVELNAIKNLGWWDRLFKKYK